MELDENGIVVGVRECVSAAEIDSMAGVEFVNGTIEVVEGELWNY